jgi:hypothetical protein
VAWQELNLLQFASAAVTKPRAGSSQIVRGKPLQTDSLGPSADSVPDNIVRDAFAPDLAFFADGTKDPAPL